MSFNYLVVLFKNKEKKKIINKFKTYDRADEFFKLKLEESDSVVYNRTYENGIRCEYELAIVGVGDSGEEIYIKDELGRQSKVEVFDGGFYIRKIKPYRVEEKILDYQTKKKLTLSQVVTKYLKKDGLKMVSKLNNKIIIQNDDDFKLFTLKNIYDSENFIDSVSEHFRSIGRFDCIFIKDISTVQRKELYEILVTRGFPKRYLTRLSTTHLK
jgi:hypothetical protein